MLQQLEEISNFYTYLRRLPNNTQVAALVFPSGMRDAKYPHSFDVDLNTGTLYCTNCNFRYSLVPNNTAREIADVKFRVACNQNLELLQTLNFESDLLWSLEQALVDWLYYIPNNCTHTVLYGGEILNTKMLTSICRALSRSPEKRMCVYTYNGEAVKNARCSKAVPENLFLYGPEEWSYIVTDKVAFKFPDKNTTRLIVPVSSKNYKYLCKSLYRN